MPDERQAHDTQFGYVRRTGPATAELLDKNTGTVYCFNFAAYADQYGFSMEDGREIADRMFGGPSA